MAVMRRWSLRWGATAAEFESDLPGDELLTTPSLVSTRAVTIEAAVDDVWPWVVQLGQGRGGFYSYDRLENLFGCDIHSADEVVPEWQHLSVGDQVRLAPEVALCVARVEPARALVLRGGVPMGPTAAPYDFTWAFVLNATNGRRTRLVVRERYAYTSWWTGLMVEPMQLVSLVMTQRMLRTIRNHATRSPTASSPNDTAYRKPVDSR
jgi:hypothetical protein